jgi:hypothetical protein
MQHASHTTVHVAIPAMNEAESLPATLECLKEQVAPGIEIRLWICVNQPDHWWRDAEKLPVCLNNRKTLEYLSDKGMHDRNLRSPSHTNMHQTNLHLIDRSSPGLGWTGKDHGVGMARKTLMDAIDLWCSQSAVRVASAAAASASDEEISGKTQSAASPVKVRTTKSAMPEDIILSLDADTVFGPHYLASVAYLLQKHPAIMGLSNPYYHILTGDEALDRAMLRYEIYMRHYAINMWRIGSPYSFTALGSAIALPLRAYRKIGGMTAKKSGEDFYLLQKLCKTGRIIQYNTETVYPATRYSDRVFFGTGPALIKGRQGDWASYPVYDQRLFDQVEATYRMFPELYDGDLETPMSEFLRKQFCSGDVFRPLRKNAATREQFIRACHHRIDGLRILQFLKTSQAAVPHSDEKNLEAFIHRFCREEFEAFVLSSDGRVQDSGSGEGMERGSRYDTLEGMDFRYSSVGFLDKIRNLLFEIESAHRKRDMEVAGHDNKAVPR